MTITINHVLSLDPTLVRVWSSLFEGPMSQLSDKIDALTAAVAAERDQVQAAIATLKATVEDLKVKLEQDTVTPDEMAKLDAAVAAIEGIYTPEV